MEIKIKDKVFYINSYNYWFSESWSWKPFIMNNSILDFNIFFIRLSNWTLDIDLLNFYIQIGVYER